MGDRSPAELLPALYRSVLDEVAALERRGERLQAAQFRAEAIRAYSRSWDATGRRRLEAILRRAERALADAPEPAQPEVGPARFRGNAEAPGSLDHLTAAGDRARRYPVAMPDTVRSTLDRALDALDGLQQLGEDVEDEWTYVTDLGEAWRSRLEEVVAARGDEALTEAASAAVDRVIDEVALISDPHRAIDWLSTFPQVVLVAVGERP